MWIISIIGLIGLIINRLSVFTILLGLELIIIGLIIEYVTSSLIYNMDNGMYITIIIVILAGIESLVGLALLVNYYKC